MKDIICSKCKGSGLIKCNCCEGNGIRLTYNFIEKDVPRREWTQCPVCDGKKKIECPTCHGTGFAGG